MESTSKADSGTSSPRSVDPAADLALLGRAKSVAHLDQFLDFGPWWYAPMLATTIGGLMLFGQAVGNLFWNGAIGLVAVMAGALVTVHDYRRRAVRSGPSTRGAGFLGLIVVLCWLIIAAWGTVISSLGYERFFPGYAVGGWALTTLVFLGVRAILLAIRSRRAPLR